MRKVLNQTFFVRNTTQVAKELIGKFLVTKVGKRNKKELAGMIREVEVYDGFYDRASHGSRGQTPRNTPMFGPPGHWYVYFTYGMHWMLNITTREHGYPAAVLIRAVVIPDRQGPLPSRRPRTSASAEQKLIKHSVSNKFSKNHPFNGMNTSGPGRLTKVFGIDKRFNTKLASKKTGLWVEDRGVNINPRYIKKTARIGVDYAGLWAEKKLRFILQDSPKNLSESILVSR